MNQSQDSLSKYRSSIGCPLWHMIGPILWHIFPWPQYQCIIGGLWQLRHVIGAFQQQFRNFKKYYCFSWPCGSITFLGHYHRCYILCQHCASYRIICWLFCTSSPCLSNSYRYSLIYFKVQALRKYIQPWLIYFKDQD